MPNEAEGELKMRIELIECKDRRTAWRRAPWASRLIKVQGGYRAYESITDWETAMRQI